MSLQIIRQDITGLQCDVIVNATNENLQPGGRGVDALIHTGAGPELLAECKSIGHVDTGKAVMTDAYNLPCKKVIHTAGPVWAGGKHNEQELLRSCYTESLKLAAQEGYESVAFPLISSGTYRFPKDKVLKIAADAIFGFLLEHDMDVYLVLYDRDSFSIGKKLFSDVKDFIGGKGANGSDAPAECKKRRTPRLLSVNKANIAPDTFEYRQADEPEEPLSENAAEDICCSAVLSDEIPIDSSEKAQVTCTAIPAANAEKSAKRKSQKSEISLENMIAGLDESFPLKLMRLIDLKGMTDVECYKKANVSRQTWSKILNDSTYRPSKNTVTSFAIALQLTYEETQALLATAGFTLSGSIVADRIITYFLKNGRYDIFEIEATLFKFDQAPLCKY